MRLLLPGLFSLGLLFSACQKDEPGDTNARLQLDFRFDPNQQRLNNVGAPAEMPAGHAAQTPDFQALSVHYVELAPAATTRLGDGAIVYHAPETTLGGENAVDFDRAARSDENLVFAEIDLKDVPPGTYEWVRASVTFQQYEIKFNIRNLPVVGDLLQQNATVASFVGFNTYITTYKLREKTLTVNDDKKQGFWAFETNLSGPYATYNQLSSGQAPAGATTVVNPLFLTSPVPAGSCVVTGRFATPLVITGKETANRKVTLSFSINQSFEWQDFNGNGQLDFYADGTTQNEAVVDMGLRGLIPSWQ